MRILFINSVYKYGSTGRLVHDLKESMKGLGHEVLVAYGRHKQEADEDAFYFGSNVSSLGHLLATRLMGNHGLHSTRKTKRLIKVIKEFKPDVIHLHNLHGYYLNVPLLFDFLNKIDVPVVMVVNYGMKVVLSVIIRRLILKYGYFQIRRKTLNGKRKSLPVWIT